MGKWDDRYLRLMIRRGALGEGLAAKYAAASQVYEPIEKMRQLLSQGLDSKTAVVVRGSLAANDYLESLPRDEAFKKVASVAGDTVGRIRDEWAQSRQIKPPARRGDSPFDYPPFQDEVAGIKYSPLLHRIGVLAQLWSGRIGGIPNRPGPLASMLVMGSLGSAAGYGGGKLMDLIQGRSVPGRARNMAIAGGAAGLIPGLGYMGLNMAAGQPGATGKLDRLRQAMTGKVLDLPKTFEENKESSVLADLSKFASAFTTDQLRDLLEDPYVANRLPPVLQSATIGLVEGAQHQTARRTGLPIVTPMDVANMAVGLGSGYVSGMIVGKALGGLLGVSDSAQQVLRQSGMAAGLIRSVVPLAFGG